MAHLQLPGHAYVPPVRHEGSGSALSWTAHPPRPPHAVEVVSQGVGEIKEDNMGDLGRGIKIQVLRIEHLVTQTQHTTNYWYLCQRTPMS